MVTKKVLLASILTTLCLFSVLFMTFPTRSSSEIYDPWGDVSGPTIGEPDGTINMRDIQYEILHFNTHGTPMNRTQIDRALELERLVYEDWYDGLIGYWKLDEGTGNEAIDSSGNNNTGILYGSNWTDGKYGNALNFDGTDDYVAIPDLYSSSPTELTVSAWINSSLISTWWRGQPVIHQCRNGEFGWELVYDGVICFGVKLASGIGIWDVRWNPSPDEWHQIVGTWKKGDSLKMYVDGTLVNQTAVNDEFLYDAYWLDASIGSLYRSEAFFNGTIDEVMVYNRTLSAEEVMLHYLFPPP